MSYSRNLSKIKAIWRALFELHGGWSKDLTGAELIYIKIKNNNGFSVTQLLEEKK